jgi:hypothetical protein
MNKWADYYIACNPKIAQSATSNHLSVYKVPPMSVGLNVAIHREVSSEREDYVMTQILLPILRRF